MPKNDDGEFELVLANRQLLSVFFIVVILLGVFFTMGYIVGRNSAPVVSDAASVPKPDVRAPVPDTPARPIDTAPVETAPPQKEPAETAVERPVITEPQRAEPESPKRESPKAVREAPLKEAPVREAKEKKPPKAEKKPALPSTRVVPGQMYLQLAATSRHEADIMVDVLRKKGFKSITAEIEEKPGTFRVLVGPVTDAGSTNQMRSDLQSAGFPGNAAIRRTF